MADLWEYDGFRSDPSHYQQGSPGRRTAEQNQRAHQARIAGAGSVQRAGPGGSIAATAGLFAVAVVVSVLLAVSGALGSGLHGLHSALGLTAPLPYWLAGAVLALGLFQYVRRKRFAGLTMAGALALFMGTCGDGLGHHPRALPTAEEIAFAQVYVLDETVEARMGPGADYPVRSRLPARSLIRLAPRDANGWAEAFLSGGSRSFGYIHAESTAYTPYRR